MNLSTNQIINPQNKDLSTKPKTGYLKVIRAICNFMLEESGSTIEDLAR